VEVAVTNLAIEADLGVFHVLAVNVPEDSEILGTVLQREGDGERIVVTA
jgi:hypothetical protein